MENVKGLERRVKELEMGEGRRQQEEIVREGKGREKMEDRVKDIERKMELKEREERKKNILIRGLGMKEGKRRDAVEEMLERIEVKVEIEEVKRLGGDKDKRKELIWVRLGNEAQKRKVMEKKFKLRGKKERILEGWTWKERKMR